MHGTSVLRLLSLLLAAGVAAALHLSNVEPYLAAERFAHDLRVRLSAHTAAERRVVIVDIDERSLVELGPWPWPRERVASLIDALAGHYRAALIGVDIVFPDPRNGDARLRASFQNAPVVLAQVFDPAIDSANRSGQLGDPLDAPSTLPRGQAGGYVANAQSLLFPGVRVGHITPTLDNDGKVRRLQAVWCYQSHCTASLGLRMFMALSGATAIGLTQGAWGEPAVRLSPDAGVVLPVDRAGRVVLPYHLAPDAFAYISAADVLSERAPPAVLGNALVLVGSTALGLGDRVATPVSALSPGVAVHAEFLSALLDNRLAVEFPYAGAVAAAVGLGWVLLLLTFAGQDMHPWRLVAWVTAGIVAWGAANLLMWREFGLAVPVWPTWVFLMLSFALLAPLENRRAWRQLGRLVGQVSSYIPAPIVQRLLGEGRSPPGLDVEQRPLTVLFADMRGFTTFAEQESPDRVALLVQRLVSQLSTVVAAHGGTVEKFTGDGLMAIWGAPYNDAEHAAHAVSAATALQEAMTAMQPWLAENSFPALRLGVGINTGEAMVGIYGDASHRAFSAHGDAVNVAERIQRLTQELGIPVLFGQATAQYLPEAQRLFVGSYPVKGRVQPVEVWCRPQDALPAGTTNGAT